MSETVKRDEVVGPRLRILLVVVLGLFALMVVDSAYLVGVTLAGVEYQDWFYLLMFLAHVVLGLLLVAPFLVFGLAHLRRARTHRNRRAVRAGFGLFTTACLLLVTGLVLLRLDVAGLRLELNHPLGRSVAYWAHVLLPVVAAWLFVLHRLAGDRIRWRLGLGVAFGALAFAFAMVAVHAQDPRAWNVVGPESGEAYFFPSRARTTSGNFIPASVLQADEYCRDCHADIHDGWLHSAHRLGSFNNPAYLFSIRETRRVVMQRDGSVQASRWCAGCHDPVPFFSGAFEDPRFDDPEYDLSQDPLAQAGITCTACHAITHVNSVLGNSDYTIDEPVHYPFAFSSSSFLRWVNRQLVKAKPEFHRATFLKPEVHRTTEFCGSCHKVHLPPEVNGYKWFRGQNHYDSFLLSGVSGHGAASFYYPDEAEENCNGCHMPLREVTDRPNFGARVRDESGAPTTFDHQFPSANTALPHLLRDRLPDAEAAIEAHRDFLTGTLRVDIFGIREDARIDGSLHAPLRPEVPTLRPGASYLLEVVVRTTKLGHLFTQGTADSNEVWLDVEVRQGERLIGRSGGMSPDDRAVDPWSHFVNAFILDRDGRRIDRRNAQDIFVALYNHQIPPGAADVVHYRLDVPPDAREPLQVDVHLNFRKFDTQYFQFFTGDPEAVNDLPVITIAEDSLTLPVAGAPRPEPPAPSPIPEWQRWNDFGIGLLRRRGAGELRQAAEAFERVEDLGRPDGPLNLARVYLREGRVQSDAPAALARAAGMGAREWSLLWFGARVAAANGDHARAVENLRDLLRGGFTQAEGRGFDFSRDYRVLDALGASLYQLALLETGSERGRLLGEAQEAFEGALALDPENLAAHWGLKQVFGQQGDREGEERHAALHARYRPDDNARDRAVAAARRRYPAANRAAEAVVIYDLHRPDALDATAAAGGF